MSGGTRDVKEFQFKLNNKLRIFPENVQLNIDNPLKLVACASKYGLTFAGCPSGLICIATSTIISNDPKKAHGQASNDFPRREVPLNSQPTHLDMSADNEFLAVVVIIQDIPVLQIYSVPSFASANILKKLEIRLSNTSGVRVTDIQWNPGVFNMISAVLSDGSAVVCECKDSSYSINSVPPMAQATCLCWSPKGKQIVLGAKNGSLTQYKPELKAVKTFAPPSPNMSVISVQWVSSFQFIVGYRNSANPSDRPVLTVVNVPKNMPVSYITYEDVCFGCLSKRPEYYFIHQQTWNLVMMGSGDSMEISVLGLEADGLTWTQWKQDDATRAELPLTQDKSDDVHNVGIALDTSPSNPVAINDSLTVNAMPLLFAMSHVGVLCVFTTLNLFPGVASICSPPHPLPDHSGTHLFTKPQIQEQAPPQMQPVQEAQVQPMAQPMQPAALQPALSSFPPKFEMNFNGGGTNATVAVTSAPQAPLFNFSQTKTVLAQPPIANSGSTFSSFSQPSNTKLLPQTGMNSSGGLFMSNQNNSTSAAPAPGIFSLGLSSSPASSVPVQIPTEVKAPVPVDTKPPSQTTGIQSSVTSAAQPAPALQAPVSSTPPPALVTTVAATTVPVAPEVPVVPVPIVDDSIYCKSVYEELTLFKEELAGVRKYMSSINVMVAEESVKGKLILKRERYEEFVKELVETTAAQMGEVNQLRNSLFDLVSWLEAIKIKHEILKNPKLREMRESEDLDPVSKQRLKNIEQQLYYVQSQLKQSVAHIEATRSHLKGQSEMVIPTMEMVLQTVIYITNILNTLKLSLGDIESKLQDRVKKMQLRKKHISKFEYSKKKRSEDSQLSTLAQKLLVTKLGSPESGDNANADSSLRSIALSKTCKGKESEWLAWISRQEVVYSKVNHLNSIPADGNTSTPCRSGRKIEDFDTSSKLVGERGSDSFSNLLVTPKSTDKKSTLIQPVNRNIFGASKEDISILCTPLPDLQSSFIENKAVTSTPKPPAISKVVGVPASLPSESAKLSTMKSTAPPTIVTTSEPLFSKPIGVDQSAGIGIAPFSKTNNQTSSPSPKSNIFGSLTSPNVKDNSQTVTSSAVNSPFSTYVSSKPSAFSGFGSLGLDTSVNSEPKTDSKLFSSVPPVPTAVTTESSSNGLTAPNQPFTFGSNSTANKVPNSGFSFSLNVTSPSGGSLSNMSTLSFGSLSSALPSTTGQSSSQPKEPVIFSVPAVTSSNLSSGITVPSTIQSTPVSSSAPTSTTSVTSMKPAAYNFSLSTVSAFSTNSTTAPTFGGSAFSSISSTGTSVTSTTTSFGSIFGSAAMKFTTPTSSVPSIFGGSSSINFSAPPATTVSSTSDNSQVVTSSQAITSSTNAQVSSALPTAPSPPTSDITQTTPVTTTIPVSPVIAQSPQSADVSPSTVSEVPSAKTDVQLPNFSSATNLSPSEIKTTETVTIAVTTPSLTVPAFTAPITPAATTTAAVVSTSSVNIFSQPAAAVSSSALVPSTTTTSPSIFAQPNMIASTSSSAPVFGSLTPTTAASSPGFSQVTPTTSASNIFGQNALPTTTSTSVFGQQTTPATTSLFGNVNTTSTSSTPFGQINSSPFGQTSTSAPTFGQAAQSPTSAFGSPAPTFGGAPAFGSSPVFGSPSTTSSVFGSGSVFGTPTTSQSIFGSNTATTSSGLFGTPTSTPSVFGSPSAAPSSAFGTPLFGQAAQGSSPFGSSNQQNPFFNSPSSNSSVFGQQSNVGNFGTSGGSLFGSGFGGNQGCSFQQGGSIFGGQSSSGPFGNSSSPGVGQAGFGTGSNFQQQKPGGFGAAPIFGSTPAFGGAPTFGTNPSFGSPNKVFGSPPAPGGGSFGASPGSPTFENIAVQNTMSFGSLAQNQATQQQQPMPSSIFGSGSPNQSSSFGGNAFTAWR